MKRLIIWLSVFVFICVSVSAFIRKKVNPVIYSVSTTQVKNLTNIALNNAIKDYWENNTGTNLVQIESGANGKINLVQTNSVAVNLLTREIVLSCIKNLETLGNEGFKIPLGSLVGVPILTPIGPKVTLKFVPVSNVNYNYYTIFQGAGINQTLHKVVLNIEANVTLLYGNKTPIVTTINEVIVSETLIVGEVPEIFLNRIY